MKYLLKFIALLIIVPSLTFAGWKIEDVKNKKLTQEQLKSLVDNMIVKHQLTELERWKEIYSESFEGLDWTRAYFEVGLEYYEKEMEMIALKAFLKGFGVFGQSPYKYRCAYYVAKIMYNQNKRESALYHINRALKGFKGDDEWTQKALELKKRISWQYISSYEGLPDDSISDIVFDGDDVWIGMWTGGVAWFTRSAQTIMLFRYKPGGLISDHVRDIAIVGNYVWVGTYGGLCRFNKQNGKWDQPFSPLKNVAIKKLEVIGNYLYVATLGKGLYYLNLKTGEWTHYFDKAPYITDIIKVGNQLYISTLNKGLYYSKKGKFYSLLNGISVKALAQMNGEVWAGTFGKGIYKIDSKSHKISKHLTKKNGLSSDYIEAMANLGNKMIIGTLEGGVCVYNKDSQTYHTIKVLNGLPSNDVVRIAVEKSYLWFGTLSGGIGILLTEDFKDL